MGLDGSPHGRFQTFLTVVWSLSSIVQRFHPLSIRMKWVIHYCIFHLFCLYIADHHDHTMAPRNNQLFNVQYAVVAANQVCKVAHIPGCLVPHLSGARSSGIESIVMLNWSHSSSWTNTLLPDCLVWRRRVSSNVKFQTHLTNTTIIYLSLVRED